MKKVWIASIFVTLMLMMSITNVVGASDTVEDCNCNPINDLHLVRIERLLDRLESRINFILLKYGHIPEVEEKCKEVLELINLDSFIDIVCKIVDSILLFLIELAEISIILVTPFLFPYIWFLVFWMLYCF